MNHYRTPGKTGVCSMRVDDIASSRVPDHIYTRGILVPVKTTAECMTYEQARKGLCAKSMGDTSVCRSCSGGCSFGKRCMELEDA